LANLTPSAIKAIPLSLYIHVPWCVQKCPYCDFNSHTLKGGLPEQEYVAHLLDDLRADAYLAQGRAISTIFIGGGTPSLLSPVAIERLLKGVADIIPLVENAEITLEANPGTVETGRFEGFLDAGVNRISIGVQSFAEDKLQRLGRIHDPKQADFAIQQARQIPLRTFNTDIMHGLPGQEIAEGLSDVKRVIAHQPPHISWYQLTIEPNTSFYSQPPKLPDDEILWEIQEQGDKLLAEAGYEQYEISAYARPGQQCQHNLNYWRFGDYLGIGCGAHGKISLPDQILRTEKVKHPRGYMELHKPYMYKQWPVVQSDYPFEYFMNRLRLVEPCPLDEYQQRTGYELPEAQLKLLEDAAQQGLLTLSDTAWQVTPLGRRYLNTLLEKLVS
jgi:putative oxygen-independent coproporphyrinogen III oxidase